MFVAYLIVSVGSAMLTMRTTVSHVFGVLSLLYLTVTVGLALFFINQVLTITKPFDQTYFSKAGEAGVLETRPKKDDAIWLRQQQLSSLGISSNAARPWMLSAKGSFTQSRR